MTSSFAKGGAEEEGDALAMVVVPSHYPSGKGT